MKQKDLEIGKFLYQYASPYLLEYKIIGQTTLSSNSYNEQFYILECQDCKDHEKCLIAVKIDDVGKIKYSHMLNHYDKDDEKYYQENSHYKNGQYYWHNDEKQLWFITRKEARLYFLNKNKLDNEKCIKDLKEKIQYYEQENIKIDDTIKSLSEND